MRSMKMPRSSPLLAALMASLALLLAGCASNIPVEDCKEEDWFQAGHKDGARGVAPKPPTEHAAACAKAGVTLDTSAYPSGWQEGIAEFCTPNSGWREGVLGNLGKTDACKGQSGEAEFSRYFTAGQETFRLNEIRRKNGEEIRRLAQQETQTRNPVERRALRDQGAALEAEQARLRKQIAQQQEFRPAP